METLPKNFSEEKFFLSNKLLEGDIKAADFLLVLCGVLRQDLKGEECLCG